MIVGDAMTFRETTMSAEEPRDGACWRCDQRVELLHTCESCHAPQPLPADTDHFAVLGLRRALVVDGADLERRYHDASRLVHPDRHQNGDAEALRLSVTTSAAVNRAYRTLREPVARGRYWLELHGRALAKDNNRVPPALATRVFEVQELLEELRDESRSGIRADVEAAHAEITGRLETRRKELEECYRRWSDATSEAVLDELKLRLSEIAYLWTLSRDVDEALES